MVHETDGFCPHVLDAQTFLAVNQWMLPRIAMEAVDRGPLIHPTADVERGARLVGPVQLGARARVRAGATIVGPTSIGADTTVGRNALVARSIVWDRSEVRDGAVVHGCVVGKDVVVPAGTRLFNVVRPEGSSPSSPLGASLWRRGKAAVTTAAQLGPAWL
jgi:NDP-sugar pyrophosphorylase family protein